MIALIVQKQHSCLSSTLFKYIRRHRPDLKYFIVFKHEAIEVLLVEKTDRPKRITQTEMELYDLLFIEIAAWLRNFIFLERRELGNWLIEVTWFEFLFILQDFYILVCKPSFNFFLSLTDRAAYVFFLKLLLEEVDSFISAALKSDHKVFDIRLRLVSRHICFLVETQKSVSILLYILPIKVRILIKFCLFVLRSFVS